MPSRPFRLTLVCVVALMTIVAVLQVSPPCHEWRAWKDLQEWQGRFRTLELRTKPAYCLGL